MYKVDYTNRFRKDVKRCQKRGLNIAKLQEAIRILEKEGALPIQYKPHKLSSQYVGDWECHIEPNWLLVWRQNDTELTLLFLYTGTHSDLF
ncbi:MAG: type II toxin-antitoxin system YafQ family toxin [Paludibacteraceae bacterium]|nr:type II toxin-antitoxin system YafQ family toxin [Paludibacteraceae bacterium]